MSLHKTISNSSSGSRPLMPRSNSRSAVAQASSKQSSSSSQSRSSSQTRPSGSRSNSNSKAPPPLPPSRSAPPLIPSRSHTVASPASNPASSPSPSPVQDPALARNANGGSYEKDIDEVLKYVERDWGSLLLDDCNPISTALELMDLSSVGRANEYDNFLEISDRLDRVMQLIAKDHHQDINNSIAAFKEVMAALDQSVARVRDLRETLTQAKRNLAR